MRRRAYLVLAGTGVTAAAAGCLGGDSDESDRDDSSGDSTDPDDESDRDDSSGDSADPSDESDRDSGDADPGQSVLLGWEDSLDWLSRHTPDPGQDATPGGGHGVVSWWAYGDWIADRADRVPVASSSERASETAEFLLARDESEALALPEEVGDDGRAIQYVMVDAAMVETEERAGGRFPALADAHPEFDRGEFYLGLSSGSDRVGTVHRQPYYESLLARLYHYHGSRAEPGPFVTRWEGEQHRTDDGDVVVQTPEDAPEGVVRFSDESGAILEEAESDPTRQVGGIGAVPAAEVPALERFRLVYDDRVPAVPRTGGNDTALVEIDEGAGTAIARLLTSLDRERLLLEFAENRPLDERQEPRERLFETTPTFTKTFERVPGARIQGSLPESATDHDQVEFAPGDSVRVSVSLDPPNGREFTYEQASSLDENLAFEMTVPYATVGYDEYGLADGYTDAGVRATGPYTVETGVKVDTEREMLVWFGADVDVREGQVVGAEAQTVGVEFEEQTEDLGFGGGDDGEAGTDTGR